MFGIEGVIYEGEVLNTDKSRVFIIMTEEQNCWGIWFCCGNWESLYPKVLLKWLSKYNNKNTVIEDAVSIKGKMIQDIFDGKLAIPDEPHTVKVFLREVKKKYAK